MKRIVTALFLLAAINCTAQDFKPTIGIDAVITKNSGGDTNALNNTTVLQTIAN